MCPHPDHFRDDGSLYPTALHLRAERRAAQAARQGRALASIDASMDRLGARLGPSANWLADADGAEWYDVDHAERLAADLAELVERHFPSRPAARS